ncbi:MAG: FAD-dependent oxidoreductase [Betaproteobacteria bacterium]|nr:FAD-dependent oxidoreductase [Betaproteobacteria bacterium]
MPGARVQRAHCSHRVGGSVNRRSGNPEDFKRATALSLDAGGDRPVTSASPQDFDWLAKNVPCRTACPAGTDIPGYLEAVYEGRFDDAYRINLRDNVFPGILGRVCSRPCEDACRHGRAGNGDPVAICFSKRSAADHLARPPVVPTPWFGATGRRVAVVGAGVAGLACARELALLGHAVTVLEKHERPGGMLNQGIPAFRLPRALVDREIGQVTALGVDVRCGVEVGTDPSLEALAADFDAVVMAAGTLRPNVPDLPGLDHAGSEHGLRFLFEVNERGRREVGRRVAVIGGGYTAMDCARTALRLGAEVTVHYRRSREDMVVLPGELEEFLSEGGRLENNVTPTALTGGAGRVAGLVMVCTRRVAADGPARAGFEPIPDSEFEVEADHVIWATGQYPDATWIRGTLSETLVARDGWLRSGSRIRTGLRNVFAAGDFALGATTLIQAIGHARECAGAVDGFLMGTDRLATRVLVEPAFRSKGPGGRTTGRTSAMNAIPIHPMPVLPPADRSFDVEVETGYEDGTARAAASRCYLCHYKFEIDDSRCVLCDECIKVKPVAGCIVEIAGLHRDEEGRITGYDPVEPGKTDSLYYNRLWIDQDQCIRCGQCEAVCPVDAITIQKVSPVTERTV